MNKNEKYAAYEYALELVGDIIQNELAIGYCLKVINSDNKSIEVTVMSPEVCCPATVKVYLTPLDNDLVRNREAIIDKLKSHLTKKRSSTALDLLFLGSNLGAYPRCCYQSH